MIMIITIIIIIVIIIITIIIITIIMQVILKFLPTFPFQAIMCQRQCAFNCALLPRYD